MSIQSSWRFDIIIDKIFFTDHVYRSNIKRASQRLITLNQYRTPTVQVGGESSTSVGSDKMWKMVRTSITMSVDVKLTAHNAAFLPDRSVACEDTHLPHLLFHTPHPPSFPPFAFNSSDRGILFSSSVARLKANYTPATRLIIIEEGL